MRHPGAGRKPLTSTDASLLGDLQSLVESTTRGDPRSPLRWACKSTRRLAEELGERGHRGSRTTVHELLGHLGYSLQSNRKTKEGESHPDRDAQLEYINRQAKLFQRLGQPAVSVDTKKAELLVMADGGGSNGARNRLWKVALAAMARETGLRIKVCHFPPGTSKWNKIEHRMFSHITQNWRGRPLVSHEVIVNLIGSTTTKKGLEIRAELDRGHTRRGRE